MNNGFREPPLRHGGDFFILSYEYAPQSQAYSQYAQKTFNIYKNINQPTPPPKRVRGRGSHSLASSLGRILVGLSFLKVEWTKLEKSRSFTLIILDIIARHFAL